MTLPSSPVPQPLSPSQKRMALPQSTLRSPSQKSMTPTSIRPPSPSPLVSNPQKMSSPSPIPQTMTGSLECIHRRPHPHRSPTASRTTRRLSNPSPTTTLQLIPTPPIATISWVVNDGDTDSSAVTSTITAAAVNDAPVFTTPTDGTITEDSDASTTTTSNLSGTLSASDADGDTLTYGIANGTVASGTSTLAGTYGSLVINTTTGQYTYTPNSSAVEALDSGDTPTDSFSVTASDGIETSTATYSVNLTGANDSCIITATLALAPSQKIPAPPQPQAPSPSLMSMTMIHHPLLTSHRQTPITVTAPIHSPLAPGPTPFPILQHLLTVLPQPIPPLSLQLITPHN